MGTEQNHSIFWVIEYYLHLNKATLCSFSTSVALKCEFFSLTVKINFRIHWLRTERIAPSPLTQHPWLAWYNFGCLPGNANISYISIRASCLGLWSSVVSECLWGDAKEAKEDVEGKHEDSRRQKQARKRQERRVLTRRWRAGEQGYTVGALSTAAVSFFLLPVSQLIIDRISR